MTPLARDEAVAEAEALIARAPQMDGEEWAVKALPILMRIVGQARAAEWRLEQENHYRTQARDYEKALREIDAMDSPFGHSRGAFREIARAALAGAGVTDNERTAEEPWCAAEGCQELPVGYDAESDEHYCAKHKEPWG